MALSTKHLEVVLEFNAKEAVQASARKLAHEAFADCTKEQLKEVRRLLKEQGNLNGPYDWMLPMLEKELARRLYDPPPGSRRIHIDGIT